MMPIISTPKRVSNEFNTWPTSKYLYFTKAPADKNETQGSTQIYENASYARISQDSGSLSRIGNGTALKYEP